MSKSLTLALMSLLLLLGQSSCVSYSDLLYFREEEELPPLPPQDILNKASIRIQPNDIVAIVVSHPDPALSAPYNLLQGAIPMGGNISSSPFATFLVDEYGRVAYPSLGEVELNGLTTLEAAEKLRVLLDQYLKGAVVNVRLLNFRIQVDGEVNRPGSYEVLNERVTILEAIAMAGGLTPYGKRENIIVIRENGNVREFGLLNLKSTDIFNSPYFYLKQNDVVYIEPNRNKVASVRDPLLNYLPLVSTSLSIIALTISLLTR